ncbi:MAG: pyridoxal phosphate-dependent aminotransferase [Gammaproteobacteria bacterium]
MEKMRFKLKSIPEYNKQWASYAPTPMHQSNPQPFTIHELEQLIGRIDRFEPEQKLDHSATQGDLVLREAITTLYDHSDVDRIATFAGAQEAIFCSLQALLHPNDTVAVITPVFEPLFDTAQDIGCEIQFIPLLANKHWKIDLNKLEEVINEDCKLLIINFPNNPTGAMISEEELRQIIEICDKNNCWILSDEVFRGLEYNQDDQLPSVADLYPKAISIGVISKAYALPAIRIGWINCQDESVIEHAINIKLSLSICNSLLDEKLATLVIKNHRKIWDRNRKLIKNNLEKLKEFMLKENDVFDFVLPEAGSVCFPLLKNNISASDYAEKLIKKHYLTVLPNHLFSTDQNGFRLGFGYKNNIDNLNSLVDLQQ